MPVSNCFRKNHLTVLWLFVSCMIYRAFRFFCLLVVVVFWVYLFVCLVSTHAAVDVLQTLFLLNETSSNHGYSFCKNLSKKGKEGFGWKTYFTQTLFHWWASLKRLLLSNFSRILFQSFESVSCQRQTEWSKRAETELLGRSYKYSREWILRREWYRQRVKKNSINQRRFTVGTCPRNDLQWQIVASSCKSPHLIK